MPLKLLELITVTHLFYVVSLSICSKCCRSCPRVRKKKNDHIYLTDSLVKYTPKQNTPLHQQGIIASTSRIIASAIMESALFQSIIAASLWNNLPDQIRTRACLSSYIRIELRLCY